MGDEILYDLGVDIDSSFQFENGDLILSSYQNNLIQSVVNRLKTNLNELELIYYDYGSILKNFLGWTATDTTLNFMKSEILKVLEEETRLVNYDCELNYVGKGNVKIELVLYPIQNISIPVNLVLRETGVIEIETDEITIGDEE